MTADHTPGEEKNASDKGREKAAAVVSPEETDGIHLEVEGQRPACLLRPRSLTSPSQFRLSRRLHSPHDAGGNPVNVEYSHCVNIIYYIIPTTCS